MQVVTELVETFGPFLIPATLFVVGVAGYAVLWLLTGQGGKWRAESVPDDGASETEDRR